MPEPLTVALLAATAVQLVTPYVTEFVKAGAGEAGKASAQAAGSGVAALWRKIRAKLSGSEAAATAVRDLEADPADADNQAAVRKELRKSLEADPEWLSEVRALMAELQPQVAASQSATIVGDSNISTQVQGNANTVSGIGHGRSP